MAVIISEVHDFDSFLCESASWGHKVEIHLIYQWQQCLKRTQNRTGQHIHTYTSRLFAFFSFRVSIPQISNQKEMHANCVHLSKPDNFERQTNHILTICLCFDYWLKNIFLACFWISETAPMPQILTIQKESQNPS